MKLVLGVCGLPASGKSTFINFSREWLKLKGWSSLSIKMSYALFTYYKNLFEKKFGVKNYKEVKRHMFQKIGDVARNELGEDAIAILTYRLLNEQVMKHNDVDVVFIDGIRDAGEVKYFDKKFDDIFYLVAIEASLEIRLKRAAERNEGEKDKLQKEEFIQRDVWEQEKYQKTINMAKKILKENKRFFKITNTGTKTELEKKTIETLKTILSNLKS